MGRKHTFELNTPKLSYEPGLHILGELKSEKSDVFKRSDAFKIFINEQIAHLSLSKVGEAYHDFPDGGFTAVICLTESHVSIHTWPEYGLATFDVFLSNYSKNNDETTHKLFELVRDFFGAAVHNYHEIRR
jgi:S-adenosylmethionine decarboxylase